jgi:sterol desaturase/sphingolipid hydroxylase (fatty acid hydroxylase superfamily)
VHDLLDPAKNPVTFAVPFFVLSILLELAALKWLDHDDNVTGYALQDARTSILMGAGSLVTSLTLKVASFFVFVWMYDHLALFHLPTDTWWSWVVMVTAVDLAYYWQHRFVHRARVGWAAHQAHHSSEYMNFGINLIYQFFVHTETIRKLPRPIEAVFNTPSHHRVHHGSDPEYLDKNYAGILIIWDRMFGTFQPEVQRPTYGLTHPVGTYHLLRLQYGDYVDLWRDVRAATSWRDRLGYVFGPPGWTPELRESDRPTVGP